MLLTWKDGKKIFRGKFNSINNQIYSSNDKYEKGEFNKNNYTRDFLLGYLNKNKEKIVKILSEKGVESEENDL